MKGLPEIIKAVPLDPQIKAHIAYYYFLKDSSANVNWQFWHYPHYYSTLLLCRKSKITNEGNTRYILADNNQSFSFIYNQNIKHAKREVLEGPYDIMGIVFRTLGFRYFFPQNLEDIDLQTLFLPIFKNPNITDKVKLLDQVFRTQYLGSSPRMIEKAVTQILATDGQIELRQLTSYLGVSRRTLLRHFKSQLDCTLREFRSVVKFRHALKEGVSSFGSRKLTELAYDAGYYDQAAFIKSFKQKTNETPKQIIPNIAQLEKELLWKLV
ncbi:MAG: helix-turn-helix domain-containing protein [Bacteroidota bacterium]